MARAYRTAEYIDTDSTCGAATIDVTAVASRGDKAWKEDGRTETQKVMRKMADKKRKADKVHSRMSAVFRPCTLID